MFNSSTVLKKHLKRFISVILVCSFLFAAFCPGVEITSPQKVYAASRLRLSTAKSVAVAKSEKIESLDLQIDAKTAAKKSAVKSLEEKERNMRSFRWSPLLNFKFPSQPNEAEAFEFSFKPTQLQYNIDTLKHKKIDAKLKEYEAVSNLYIDIITYVTEIGFLNERISNTEVTLAKNKARLAEGTATKGQLEDQQKKLDKMKKDLATQKKKLIRSEEKLGKKLGFSILSGYTFDEEFVATDMDRNTLESLTQFAIENDETVFEARQEMELARLALDINYQLISRKYGGNINIISGYISQITASDTGSVDKRAFKKDYDKFLKKIDDPWRGHWRILFIKIPKEWLKGSLDGIRYVEDDPYVLYTAALDYQAARKEYNNAIDELKSNINDSYDSMMEARDAYLTASSNIKRDKVELIAAETRNALGNLSYEEYNTMYEEYETSRTELKDSLSTYSKLLYSFDKTTCGAASAYYFLESLSTNAGAAALGTPEDDGDDDGSGKKGKTTSDLDNMNPVIAKGCTYSIRSIVDSQEFVLYVDKPDDFDIPVTDFELWADGRQIGDRQKIGSGSIRHLKLSVTDVNSIFVRIYNGNEFVDDCGIDPNVSYGPLNITKEYEIITTDKTPIIGQFTVEDDNTTDMIKVRYTFDPAAIKNAYQLNGDVKYFNMAAEKNLYLFSNELIDKDKPFTYMSFIKRDLGKLTLRLFDATGNYIGGARLDTNTNNLYADEDITNSDMQQMAARQIIAEEKSAELMAEKKRLTDLYNASKSVNSGEADSETVQYYQKKLEEIDAQLKVVAADVSDDEIAQAMLEKKDEIDKRVADMGADPSATEEAIKNQTDARNEIIKEGAKDYVRKSRVEDKIKGLEKSLSDYERELIKAQSDYKNAKTAKERKAAEERMKDVSEKIKLTKGKIADAQNSALYDDSDVSDEEIEKALAEHADEIYSDVQDELSMDMLYGTPTGQWAVQYLKSLGLPDNEDNVRSVVSHASDYTTYEDAVKRKAALENDLKSVEEKIKQLKEQGSPSDKSCLEQLEPMVDNYKKQISDIEKEIKATDPARDIR